MSLRTNPKVALSVPYEAAEQERFSAILIQALKFPADRTVQWFNEWMGIENIRVAKHAGKDAVVGGFGMIPMGHWFAGKPVKTLGINAVAIAPEARGYGIATEMMRQALLVAHERGYALSSLFPATYTVYRRVGYEIGGTWQRLKVPLTGLIKHDRELSVRPMVESDEPIVHELYHRRCAMTAGLIDRGPMMWRRILHMHGRTTYGFLIEPSDDPHSGQKAGPEGYIVWTQRELGGIMGGYELEVRDIVALTPRAARRALTLLSDGDSLARYASVPSAPTDMVLAHALEVSSEAVVRMHWLLRLVDVKAALEQRGYDPHVRGEVELLISDDVLAHNDNRLWILSVENGMAQVREGGRGLIRAHVRGLASVYTGAMTPAEVSVLGLMDGDSQQMRVLQTLFAGPAPWVVEMY